MTFTSNNISTLWHLYSFHRCKHHVNILMLAFHSKHHCASVDPHRVATMSVDFCFISHRCSFLYVFLPYRSSPPNIFRPHLRYRSVSSLLHELLLPRGLRQPVTRRRDDHVQRWLSSLPWPWAQRKPHPHLLLHPGCCGGGPGGIHRF